MLGFLTSKYILILLWIGFIAIFASVVKVTKTETVGGISVERTYWMFAFISFLPIIIMAGSREYVADTSLYIYSFEHMPTEFGEYADYLSGENKDFGFLILALLIKRFLSTDYRVYLLTIAGIQGLLLISFFRKYSPNYVISLFLFVASTDYFAWMFNGIRQFLAVTIIITATPFMIRSNKDGLLKKYIPLFAVIIFASLLHHSALLMLPIVVVAQGKAWNKKTLLFILFVLLSIFFVDNFTTFLDDALANTQYKYVVTDYTKFGDDGTNPLRAMVYMVPAILSLFGRKTIVGYNDKLVDFATNMSVMSAGLYLMSMFTSGIFIGRLPIYCSLFGYILLPWEIKNLFDQNMARWIRLAMIVLYLVFYYYQMHFAWGLL